VQLLVTGASTPLGQGLLRALAARGALTRDGAAAPIARILGVDREQPPGLFVDERVEYVCGEYEQPREAPQRNNLPRDTAPVILR